MFCLLYKVSLTLLGYINFKKISIKALLAVTLYHFKKIEICKNSLNFIFLDFLKKQKI